MDHILNSVAEALPEVIQFGKRYLIIAGVIGLIVFVSIGILIATTWRRNRKKHHTHIRR